jgi:hypothetical protein
LLLVASRLASSEEGGHGTGEEAAGTSASASLAVLPADVLLRIIQLAADAEAAEAAQMRVWQRKEASGGR